MVRNQPPPSPLSVIWDFPFWGGEQDEMGNIPRPLSCAGGFAPHSGKNKQKKTYGIFVLFRSKDQARGEGCRLCRWHSWV